MYIAICHRPALLQVIVVLPLPASLFNVENLICSSNWFWIKYSSQQTGKRKTSTVLQAAISHSVDMLSKRLEHCCPFTEHRHKLQEPRGAPACTFQVFFNLPPDPKNPVAPESANFDSNKKFSVTIESLSIPFSKFKYSLFRLQVASEFISQSDVPKPRYKKQERVYQTLVLPRYSKAWRFDHLMIWGYRGMFKKSVHSSCFKHLNVFFA